MIDEVQSGVGRTGTMWACSHDDVEPDIMCIGKGLASGLPLAGIVARAGVMDWEPGGHGSTFGGNPVACAAASATLDLVEHGLAANAATVGAHVLRGVRALQATQPLITDVRGRGLMIGIDLPDHDTAAALERACFERGLLVLTCGVRSVRMAPPLVVTIEQADVALGILADALASLGGDGVNAVLPSSAELASRAAAILAACGAAAPDGDLAARAHRSRAARSAPPAAPATSRGPSTWRPTAFATWRTTPAPVRGNLVRRLGELLREHKDDLGALVSIEAGKIRSEGRGEVQEMIDICDFAVGLSRQLHGLTIASERPGHRLMEQWQPLGPCAVITAFNFPVAVWSWNAALALVAGDPVIWKPSDKTPLTAAGVRRPAGTCRGRCRRARRAEPGRAGRRRRRRRARRARRRGRRLGDRLDAHGPRRRASRRRRASVASSSSSAATTRRSSRRRPTSTSPRGRIAFSAVGTAGQRCTSLRRLIVHTSVRDELVDRLAKAYASVPIGDPLADGTLVGPLIDAAAFDRLTAAHRRGDGATAASTSWAATGCSPTRRPTPATSRPPSSPCPAQTDIVRTRRSARSCTCSPTTTSTRRSRCRTTCPRDWRRASSRTTCARPSGSWPPTGRDCGIANVNIGPSGAEIGGAFGGEKETGGGRESGSDAWKGYMRRATNTVNYSRDLPLAQGVTFDV